MFEDTMIIGTSADTMTTWTSTDTTIIGTTAEYNYLHECKYRTLFKKSQTHSPNYKVNYGINC